MVTGTRYSYSTSAVPRMASAVDLAMRVIRSAKLLRTSGLKARVVPSSSAVPAMTLKRVPPVNLPTVTTAVSIGSSSRETRLWRFCTMAAPITTASTARCGCAPWPDLPITLTLKRSPEAIIAPLRIATLPAATSDQTCMPKQASTPSSAPSAIIDCAPRPISSAGWKANTTVPLS